MKKSTTMKKDQTWWRVVDADGRIKCDTPDRAKADTEMCPTDSLYIVTTATLSLRDALAMRDEYARPRPKEAE